MSNSVQPHRQQPTRLCPWDSPGKNTGVGCHFLLQCMKVKSESEVAQPCPTLSNPMDCSLPGSSIMGFSRQEYWKLRLFQIKKSVLLKWARTIFCLSRIYLPFFFEKPNNIIFLINFYYSIVALQCCINLCCPAKWINFMYTYIPFPFRSTQSTV